MARIHANIISSSHAGVCPCLSEASVACGQTFAFIGCVGDRALILFLFIFLYSLLMCLTKGQTLINRAVGQLVTTIFMATALSFFSLCPSVIWCIFLSLRWGEWCKEIEIHITRESTSWHTIVVNTLYMPPQLEMFGSKNILRMLPFIVLGMFSAGSFSLVPRMFFWKLG